MRSERASAMKPALRFSLLVFAPLYVAFLTPALLLLPTGVLVTLISMLDARVPVIEAAGYGVWVLGPIVAALGLLVTGIRLHPLWVRGRSHTVAWTVIWVVFSISLFVAMWFGTTIVTSIGASDYETGEFLRWTTAVAVLITLALQPGVGLWLYVATHILHRIDSALRAEP
jgi:hypothetical protein